MTYPVNDGQGDPRGRPVRQNVLACDIIQVDLQRFFPLIYKELFYLDPLNNEPDPVS